MTHPATDAPLTWNVAGLLGDDPGTGRRHAAGVRRAVDEHRHERLRHAGRERAERRAGPAVSDHRGGARQHLGLRHPALDRDRRRKRAQLDGVAAVADRDERLDGEVAQRFDRLAIDAGEVLGQRRLGPEADVHEVLAAARDDGGAEPVRAGVRLARPVRRAREQR